MARASPVEPGDCVACLQAVVTVVLSEPAGDAGSVRKVVMALARAVATCCWKPGSTRRAASVGLGHVPAFDWA